MNKRYFQYVLPAAVAALTALCYLPALKNDFVVWDDDLYIYNNLHIRSLDWTFIKWAFSDISLSHWRPLVWISHALDYSLWGLNPMGHHLTNILLHVANTFLVVYLISRLLEAFKKRRAQSGASLLNERTILVTAGVTGTLFGIHPLHVESVAWVTERKDVLYALFFLLSLNAYTSYATAAGATAIRKYYGVPSERHYYFSLAFFVMALASKPMAVTLPAVLLIMDWYPFKRISSPKGLAGAIIEKIPFIALSAAISVITVIAQKGQGTALLVNSVRMPDRLLVAATSLILYLWKMLAPLNLIPFYPFPKDISILSFKYFGSIALVIGVTAVAILLRNKQRFLLAAWCYYIVSLLPVLGIVQVGDYAMADRYTYLPSIGPFMLVGLFVAWLWEKASSMGEKGHALTRLVAGAGLVVCLALAYATVSQIGIWKDSITLWSYVIDQEQDRVPLAYNNRGVAFRAMGRYDLAMEDYNRTLSLVPRSFRAYTNRGIVYAETGQLQRAIEDFDSAIAINPSYADAYTSRGLAKSSQGQLSGALEDFNKAINLKPSSVDAYLNRGVAFEQLGKLDRALEDYGKAIALDPSDYLAYCNRGIIFAKMGQSDKAVRDYDTSISLKPDFAKAYLERAALYKKTGNGEQAIADYRRACDLGSEDGCEAIGTHKNN